mmetsp:Transcript_22764/g.32533  ORF Transcript_22764/g.32533 Transcript_22764/m.32533 type:complete len:173 (+) Transcript_22764:201-719(+)
MKITPFALAFTLCLPSSFPSALAADSTAGASEPKGNNPYSGQEERNAAAAASITAYFDAAAVARKKKNNRSNNNNNNNRTQPASNNEERFEELTYVDEGTEKGYKAAIKMWNTEFAPSQGYVGVEHLSKDFVCGEASEWIALESKRPPNQETFIGVCQFFAPSKADRWREGG